MLGLLLGALSIHKPHGSAKEIWIATSLTVDGLIDGSSRNSSK